MRDEGLGPAQEARAALAGAQAAAEKARSAAQRHQAAVAALTGDNLVLLLRARAAEEGGAALRAERDGLRAELEEQKGPWFEEVRRWRGSLPDRTSLQVFP